MEPLVFIVRPVEASVVAQARARLAAGDRTVVRRVADRHPGFPCRRCLRDAKVGEVMLLFLHSPFAAEGPYAETGPILAHEHDCAPPALAPGELPEVTHNRPQCVVRAYDGRGWIHEGKLVAAADAAQAIAAFFADAAVASVHVRNVGYGCFAYAAERIAA